jgi:type 1 glutamine amidotransferase
MVESILAKAGPSKEALRPLNLVLVASKQDHGPGEHDYPAWQKSWSALLPRAKAVTVTNAWKWPTADQLEHADVLIFYYWNHAWPDVYQQLDSFQARGGGVVLLHSSCIADQDPEELSQRIGLASHPKRSKYRHGELDLNIIAPADNPLVAGLPRSIHFLDETYWPMFGDTNKVEILALAEEQGKEWPMVWTYQRGKARVFGTLQGHYTWTHDDPLFRILVLRAIAWAAHEPISRLESLATSDVTFKSSP